MTTAAIATELPRDGRGRHALGWWGMVFLVVNEATFFAYLLFSYFYVASAARGTWPPSGSPELKIALPNTIILLISSGTMVWAERGITRGDQERLRIGLLITFLLGALFIVLQGIEYGNKMFTPQSDVYGSLFFTITGFHGAHVVAGLLMNLFVQVRAWAGHFTARRHLAVSNVALYWHFVDVVWLFVFASLYIAPRLA
ncbi:MAG TPA: cytochrome c oxidase subunit 3 [Gemmatimonadales bacterium]|nr:cytochrome c oxidase subunit 3 [Gemmatimonadales bacterium]